MSSAAENKKSKQLRILEAAFGLFTDKSVHTTAIDDIVKKAGVAKGTFYLYFKDKYDLLDQIVIHKTSSVIQGALESIRKCSAELPFAEQMILLTDYLLNYLQSNRKFASLINHNLSACFRALTRVTNEGFENVMREFVKLYSEKGYSEDFARKLIYVIINMVGSVGCDAVLNEKPYSMEEIRPVIHLSVQKMLA